MGNYARAILADLLQNKTSRHSYPATLKTIPNCFPAVPFRHHLLRPAEAGLALEDLKKIDIFHKKISHLTFLIILVRFNPF